MLIRLTRKLANTLNGMDLKQFVVGDVIDLPDQFAGMLIAEGWAEPAGSADLATAADRPSRRRTRVRKAPAH